ncbi:adenosylcobinamide-phosphate synthase CbiB [Undibacterium sp. Di24W]|uniref:adenosylcobinamide-phosphate synthase CbiB n=1 Tax=Undibacterium sp. Di24W TaxID=3413033 RepID=UPI003BF2809F
MWLPELQSLFIAPMSVPLVMWLSVGIDRYLGEPVAALHPVVWMGKYQQALDVWIAPESRAEYADAAMPYFVFGILAWLLGAILVLTLSFGFIFLLTTLPDAYLWLGTMCSAYLLKSLWTWSLLAREVAAVESALCQSLAAGRERLSYLVSRDVTQLDAVTVRESAIETLAENLNDSVVSPLLWFAMAGLPGVALYRFANTADAMWGYRGERGGRVWTWAGKWAARTDDVLSWPGARLTTALLYLAAWHLPRPNLLAEVTKTDSPNGGWPMAAMALILNVRLAKPGAYVLHTTGSLVEPKDTEHAIQLGQRTTYLCCALISALFCL